MNLHWTFQQNTFLYFSPRRWTFTKIFVEMASSLKEIRDPFFWRAVAAEFLATAIFVMNVTLVATLSAGFPGEKIVVISFAIGMSVSVLGKFLSKLNLFIFSHLLKIYIQLFFVYCQNSYKNWTFEYRLSRFFTLWKLPSFPANALKSINLVIVYIFIN